MWKKFESQLGGANVQIRLEGWSELYSACLSNEFIPKREDVLALNRLLLREEHRDVAALAARVMAAIAALLAARPAASSGLGNQNQPGALGHWLWQPFLGCSVVFLPLDPDNHRRDESAAIILARHLSSQGFPNTDFQPIILGGPGLDRFLLARPYEAFCLIGRPGLYGAELSPLWSNDRTRFRFPVQDRPRGLPIGTLDQDYHCIAEQVGGRRKLHHTREQSGRRTDFGLVQRCIVNHDGMRNRVVVVCAGATSLGTMAAVRWAASEVLRPVCLGGDPIPAPGQTGDDSLMEVLLQVSGEKQSLSWSWEPSQVQVLRLCVDGKVWCSEDRDWHTAGPDSITVVRDRNNPEQVLEVLFDDRPAPLKKESQIFRLLGSACLQVGSGEGKVVDTDALIRQAWIWGATAPTAAEVHRHFTILRSRYLHDALTVSRSEIVLHAQVTIR
jgi:hypothetical protein